MNDDDAVTVDLLACELAAKEPHQMELVLRPVSVFEFVAALQLARRHPQFAEHETIAATVDRFLLAAREYFVDCPTVLEVIAKGDDPTHDR